MAGQLTGYVGSSQSALFVRPAVASDAVALLALFRQFNGTEHAEQDPRQVAQALDRPGGEIVLVAELASRLVGFACVQVFRSAFYDRPSLELTELWVEPQARRRGAGTALMQEIREQARILEALEINLRARRRNRIAAEFYRANGLERADHDVWRTRCF